MMISLRLPTLLLVAALVAAPFHPAAAQSGGPRAIALLAGPTRYDTDRVGTSPLFAAALTLRGNRTVVVEPRVSYFDYVSGFDIDRERFLLPELGLQVQTGGRIRPFIGGGAGVGLLIPARYELTLHAVGGIRADLGADWGLRTELRLRAIDPFAVSTADLLFGVGRRVF